MHQVNPKGAIGLMVLALICAAVIVVSSNRSSSVQALGLDPLTEQIKRVMQPAQPDPPVQDERETVKIPSYQDYRETLEYKPTASLLQSDVTPAHESKGTTTPTTISTALGVATLLPDRKIQFGDNIYQCVGDKTVQALTTPDTAQIMAAQEICGMDLSW